VEVAVAVAVGVAVRVAVEVGVAVGVGVGKGGVGVFPVVNSQVKSPPMFLPFMAFTEPLMVTSYSVFCVSGADGVKVALVPVQLIVPATRVWGLAEWSTAKLFSLNDAQFIATL
jgi:hypothetical protein